MTFFPQAKHVRNTVIEGDCLEALVELPAQSVDVVITDPPYGLKFLGHQWDHGVPGVPFWEAIARVAKPGALLFAFGGTRTFHHLMCSLEDANWTLRDTMCWIYGGGFPKGGYVSRRFEKRADVDNALKWEGWGSTLKPAWEPIIIAQNAYSGSLLQNLADHGVGALNIDANKILSGEEVPRWPANVAHDGSEEVLAGFPHTQVNRPGGATYEHKKGMFQGFKNLGQKREKSSGSTSRFFYCARASARERGKDNKHPTVKPLALMRYLCRLACPPGGLILDPFCGSGSTGVAAALEGFSFLGVENDPHYAAIARQRIVRAYGSEQKTP